MNKKIVRGIALPLVAVVTMLLAGCSGSTTGVSNQTVDKWGHMNITLNGTVTCTSGTPTPCSFYFQWGPGTGTSYPYHTTPSGGYVGSVSNYAVSATICCLQPWAQYTYEICGKGDANLPNYACGAPYTFTTGGESAHQWDQGRVNDVRAAHGARALYIGSNLDTRAQYWANHLASSNLPFADDVNGAQTCFAGGGTEFGGNASIVWPTGNVFNDVVSNEYNIEGSPPHFANMINTAHKWMGIGIAVYPNAHWDEGNLMPAGTVVVIQEFCG